MKVCFNGFGENVLTFETQGTIDVGDPVMISGNGKVKKATSNFCGICTGLRNGYASVQMSGYVRTAYTTAPEVGYSKLSASNGKVTADDVNGREYLVLDVDTTEHIVGIIL